jgi:hypothetical protein
MLHKNYKNHIVTLRYQKNKIYALRLLGTNLERCDGNAIHFHGDL